MQVHKLQSTSTLEKIDSFKLTQFSLAVVKLSNYITLHQKLKNSKVLDNCNPTIGYFLISHRLTKQ